MSFVVVDFEHGESWVLSSVRSNAWSEHDVMEFKIICVVSTQNLVYSQFFVILREGQRTFMISKVCNMIMTEYL